MTDTYDKDAFAGRCIALPESRQLDVLAALFERRGATVRRCPLVSIHDTPDQQAVHQWLTNFIADPTIRDLVLLTGEGARRLIEAAERFGVKAAFIEKLKRIRLIARGPKPGRTLKAWDIHPQIQAKIPTSQGVIETLQEMADLGPRIGVVLYGSEPNRPLIQAIAALGRQSAAVAPYIYASESEAAAVADLIHDMAQGKIDALAFTSQPQFKRMQSVAEKYGKQDELTTGLGLTHIAAIGPVMADYLREQGVRVDVMPEERYFMKPLVDALSEYLNRSMAMH
ncbi:uroporphyrinogen-III synthase [Halothiobacillus sp.]|uniref:uroporphyrinogen-III synthase n=1 Tax=Halothiobacillus sp. TaxID=1891311 RepID=UPI00262D6A30|nr:uroporphyrinogen-III synthase [Halothiobacillus sp.]